jgi:hypothetical protein
MSTPGHVFFLRRTNGSGGGVFDYSVTSERIGL